MRRNFMKSVALGAMAMAGLAGTQGAMAAKTVDNTAITAANSKATTVKKEKKGAIKVNPYTGGLDMTPSFPGHFGMTPKEYGMRYGNGGSKKSNRNRYAHNAKLKRRKAQ